MGGGEDAEAGFDGDEASEEGDHVENPVAKGGGEEVRVAHPDVGYGAAVDEAPGNQVGNRGGDEGMNEGKEETGEDNKAVGAAADLAPAMPELGAEDDFLNPGKNEAADPEAGDTAEPHFAFEFEHGVVGENNEEADECDESVETPTFLQVVKVEACPDTIMAEAVNAEDEHQEDGEPTGVHIAVT